MAQIPLPSREYSTRANIPFTSHTNSQRDIESFFVYTLSKCLLNTETSGTLTGTRHPDSVWMCRGSGNASTSSLITSPGVSGTNLWEPVLTGTMVRGTSAARHHWMLLELSSQGYEGLLNFSQTDGYYVFTIGVTGSFGGQTGVSQMPTASNASDVVAAGAVSWNTTDGGQVNIFTDSTNIGGSNYFHFTCAETGEFHAEMSRAGTALFSEFVAMWRSSGSQVGDKKYNMFNLCGDGTNTGRGTPNYSRIGAHAFCASRQPSGVSKTAGGCIIPFAGGTQFVGNQGIDAIASQYNSFKLEIGEISPQYVKRGALQDFYIIGTAQVGSSYPSTDNQKMIVVGDLLVPFSGTIALL